MSSIFDSFESSKHSSGETKNTNEEKKSGNQQQTEQDGKLKITRVFDFAGENVE